MLFSEYATFTYSSLVSPIGMIESVHIKPVGRHLLAQVLLRLYVLP